MNIGIIGNIGVGKSTLATLLEQRVGGKAMLEPVVNNPYLDDFYKDMKGYAFPLQIYFLNHRLKNAIKTTNVDEGLVWQDRTVREDKDIFAANLADKGLLSERDWETYCGIYETMAPHFEQPHLYIYLEATVDTLIDRIARRGRDFEKSIPRDYLEDLNKLYLSLHCNLIEEGANVLVIPMGSDGIDLTRQKDADQVVAMVREVAGAHLLLREASRKTCEHS